MNQPSKDYWKLLIYRSVGSYRDFFYDREVESIALLEDGSYRVKTTKEGSKDYFVEICPITVKEYLKYMKTPYSKIELNSNLDFEEIITDPDLFRQKLKEAKEYAEEKLPKLVSTFGNSQEIEGDRNV